MKLRIKSLDGELPPEFTLGKTYQSVSTHQNYAVIVDDYGVERTVCVDAFSITLGGYWEIINEETPTMNKLKEAVQNSGLSKSELSRRLGKHRNYIGEMLRVGCSTKKQNELIEMINQVKAGERFKSDDEIIAELSEKLDEQQQENSNMRSQSLLDGITIGELETKNSDLIRVANQKSEQVKNLSTRNTDLEKALTDERKNAQELTGKLEKEKQYKDTISKECNRIRAEKTKLEDELTKAGEELLRQDETITYQSNKIIKLNDECLLLSQENSELNKQRKSYMAAFFMLLSLVVICLLWSAFK